MVAYYWLLLFLPACIALYFINLLQSSSNDGIAVVTVCCQSMSSVQYACNSTEAAAPLVFHIVRFFSKNMSAELNLQYTGHLNKF